MIDDLDYDFNSVDTGFLLPDDEKFFEAQVQLDAIYTADADERLSPATPSLPVAGVEDPPEFYLHLNNPAQEQLAGMFDAWNILTAAQQPTAPETPQPPATASAPPSVVSPATPAPSATNPPRKYPSVVLPPACQKDSKASLKQKSDQLAETATDYALKHHMSFVEDVDGDALPQPPSSSVGLTNLRANITKGKPFAAAVVSAWMALALLGDVVDVVDDAGAVVDGYVPLWSADHLQRLDLHKSTTTGTCIYSLLLKIPQECLDAAVAVYKDFSDEERAKHGFTGVRKDKPDVFMKALIAKLGDFQYFADWMYLFYAGQTWGEKACPNQRYRAHWSKYAQNLLKLMESLLKKLVRLSTNDAAKALMSNIVVYRLFVFPPKTLAALASKAGVTAKLMTTLVEHAFVVAYLSMYLQAGGNSVYPVDDLWFWVLASGASGADTPENPLSAVHNQPSFMLNVFIEQACIARHSGYQTMTVAQKLAVRSEVLLLNWGDVTDYADMFEQILAKFYADLDPAVVTTRQLQSLICSSNNRLRKNITIPEVHLVTILYHGVEKWFDAHGLMYSFDVEPAVGVEQFFYFQVKQRKNVGTISYVIDSQTGANLPLHKALYDIDQSIPVTVPRKRWPDLRPFGFSTGARKGEDKRPPGGKITVQRGPIIQHAVTGDRYRMWTQVVVHASILLPPHITIRETLPATPSATTGTSEPL
jgi:hypothetical protein